MLMASTANSAEFDIHAIGTFSGYESTHDTTFSNRLGFGLGSNVALQHQNPMFFLVGIELMTRNFKEIFHGRENQIGMTLLHIPAQVGFKVRNLIEILVGLSWSVGIGPYSSQVGDGNKTLQNYSTKDGQPWAYKRTTENLALSVRSLPFDLVNREFTVELRYTEAIFWDKFWTASDFHLLIGMEI